MSKKMNFGDGLKDVYVGMKVAYTNGQHGNHRQIYETFITGVGRKYATVTDGNQFKLENGYLKTNYTAPKLYSSRVALWLELAKNDYISLVNKELYRRPNLTYEESVAVARALKLNIKEIE